MKSKKIRTKIMAFGTFDGLHKGHINFFKQARKLAPLPYLIVSVARDINVKRIKGESPRLNEIKRKNLIKNCALVDKVVLGGARKHIPHIVKESPDIIVLGYDQSEYIKNLKIDLKKRGKNVKIIRLKPYKEKKYKNSLLRRK